MAVQSAMMMSPKAWLTATLIAAVTLAGAAQAFVYPRSQGEKVEKRVIKLEDRVDSREDKFTNILGEINGRLSNIEGQLKK